MPFVRLAEIESRLDKNLSLLEIEQTQQDLLDLKIDPTLTKTSEVVLNYFNCLEGKKKPLIEREVSLIAQTRGPQEKIDLLRPLIPYLTAEEIEITFEAIEGGISLLGDQKIKEAVTRQLQDLQFAQANPLLFDLEEFKKQVRDVARRIHESGSLVHLNGLSQVQLGEVSRRRSN